MIYIVFIILLCLVVFFLIIIGKPRSISFSDIPLLDSFEKTNFTQEGRTKFGYLTWDERYAQNSEYLVPVYVSTFSHFQKYPFNWNYPILINLNVDIIPIGFELFLNYNNIEYSIYTNFPFYKKNPQFFVGIRKTDILKVIDAPELIKFTINAVGTDRLFGNTKIRKSLTYEFYIGTDLGNTWVAFDPGTTATCIATGSDSRNINLTKIEGETIIPSVLTFRKDEEFEKYKFGNSASKLIKSRNQYVGFRSIKKLLGFKDELIIDLVNENIKKSGKELAALLIKGIYNDTKITEVLNPKRAVVAIPNNSTALKIQDIIYCIENLNQFKEIRYIHEAEAILFYYLSNYKKLNESGNGLENEEVILVFDMGGATINATIAKITKKSKNYCIDILSKIGYGIGGDTIDYCILKTIFDFKKDIPALEQIDIFCNSPAKTEVSNEYLNIKERLISLALILKQEIVENHRRRNVSELIPVNQLKSYIKDAINNTEDINIDEESPIYYRFKKSSRKVLFNNSHFRDLLYTNVEDAVREVLNIAGNPNIDKVIFAGRSTSFPLIQETVTGEIRNSVIEIDLKENAKTAVVEGACWYGINKSAIELNNFKTSATFGFTQTMSTDKNDIKFHKFIAQGESFINSQNAKRTYEGLRFIENKMYFCSEFNYDGNNLVNFYQVMGQDADTIISENQKHKFSKVSAIKAEMKTAEVGMKVSENDKVKCVVKLCSGKENIKIGAVADQEICEANEEHYYWMVK